jgi:hypothetical protein
VRVERHYSYYSETRHNFCTCKVEIEDADSSNTSKYYYCIACSIIICCGVALRCCIGAALVFCRALSRVKRLVVNYVTILSFSVLY